MTGNTYDVTVGIPLMTSQGFPNVVSMEEGIGVQARLAKFVNFSFLEALISKSECLKQFSLVVYGNVKLSGKFELWIQLGSVLKIRDLEKNVSQGDFGGYVF